MGYAVVHMQKIKAGAVGGIQSHNNREHPPQTNPDVDLSRSSENYDLIPCRNYHKAIKEKIADLVITKKAVRKDAVISCNFIITSDNKTMSDLGADRQRYFFEDALQWFSDRYGADRILNATVHMDETTPHLHIGIVPITQDGRLSAKDIFTKSELKFIQTNFAEEVGLKYGLERGKEGSERTHLSETRFKLKKAQEDLSEITENLIEIDEKLYFSKIDLQDMLENKKALEGELEALLQKKEILTSAEVHSLTAEKTILGGLKGVSYKEFELLKKTAEAVDEAFAERDQANARAEQYKKLYEEDRPSLKLQRKIASLENVIDILQTKYPEVYRSITEPDRQRRRSQEKTFVL